MNVSYEESVHQGLENVVELGSVNIHSTLEEQHSRHCSQLWLRSQVVDLTSIFRSNNQGFVVILSLPGPTRQCIIRVDRGFPSKNLNITIIG